MSVCLQLLVAIYRKFKLNERKRRYISNLHTCKNVLWSRRRTPHRVTQRRWVYWVRETDCVWSETAAPAPKRTGRKAIRADWGKLDRRRVTVRNLSHSVDPSAWQLHSEGSIVSTCTEHYKCYITQRLISDNIPVSARSGSPPQCSTFSSCRDYNRYPQTTKLVYRSSWISPVYDSLVTVWFVMHGSFLS